MEFINETSTCKKCLNLHVTPNGVFSMVAEHNFFGRLGTCRKVMGGEESEGMLMGVGQRPCLEAVLPKRQVRNVLYSKFCTGKING